MTHPLRILTRSLILTLLGWAVFLPFACSPPLTVEERVRIIADEVEEAMENHDIKGVLEHVSEGYRDGYGYDKQTLKQILFREILRGEKISILKKLNDVIVEENEVHVGGVAAVTWGITLDNWEAVEEIKADVARVKVTLIREKDDWRVVSAEWRGAGLQDLPSLLGMNE